MGVTGYSPKEAAKILTEAGFPISGKQIRRALRKGTLKATQLSGRWYIPRKNLTTFSKARAKAQEAKSN